MPLQRLRPQQYTERVHRRSRSMSTPTCHVLCGQRGSAMCRTAELAEVKAALNALNVVQAALVSGNFGTALRQLEEARECIDAAELAHLERR